MPINPELKESKVDVWMPLYIKEFIANTQHLSAAEIGAYISLLIIAWKSGGFLDNDEASIFNITKLEKNEWKKAKPRLMKFFTVEGNKLVQERLKTEYNKALKVSQERKIAGSKGGKKSTTREAIAQPIATDLLDENNEKGIAIAQTIGQAIAQPIATDLLEKNDENGKQKGTQYTINNTPPPETENQTKTENQIHGGGGNVTSISQNQTQTTSNPADMQPKSADEWEIWFYRYYGLKYGKGSGAKSNGVYETFEDWTLREISSKDVAMEVNALLEEGRKISCMPKFVDTILRNGTGVSSRTKKSSIKSPLMDSQILSDDEEIARKYGAQIVG